MFEINKFATLKKVELRNSNGDESKRSVALRFDVEDVPAGLVSSALGAEDGEEVIRSFFRSPSEDADQNVRYHGLKALVCSAKWEDKHTLKLPGVRTQRVAKVTGIKLKPRGKATFDCEFSCTIETPPEGMLDSLQAMLNHSGQIVLKQDGDLFTRASEDDTPETQEGLPLEGGGEAAAPAKRVRVRKPKEPNAPRVAKAKVAKEPKAKPAKPKAKRKK